MAGNLVPKKVSLAFGSKPKPSNGVKRSHAALHDSDEEDSHTSRHQEISSFDLTAGGAIQVGDSKTNDAPLVIPAKPNTDRLGYGRKRQRSNMPVTQGVDIEITKKEVKYGLSVPEAKLDQLIEEAAVVGTAVNGAEAEVTNGTKAPDTEDQLALNALLSNGDSTKIIAIDEDAAYRRDVDEAQDRPTLEDYLSITPDAFGAAILRGCGWTNGETLKTGNEQHRLKPKSLEKRPALLGLGAKPSSAVGIELGEWGKATRGKNAKNENYNPVVLRNKNTGEVLTEAEMKTKLEEQDKPATPGMVFDDNTDRHAEKGRRQDDHRDRHEDRPRDDYRDRYRDKDRDTDRDRERKIDKYDSDPKRERERDNRKDGDDRDRRRLEYSADSNERYKRRKDDGYRSSDRRSHRRSRSHSSTPDSRYRSSKHDNRRDRDHRKDRHRDEKHHKYKDEGYEKDAQRERSERGYEKSSSRRP